MNTHGSGEISNWDLTDESASITLVAFNLNSHIMADKIKKDKTLPHQFQLVCTNATRVQEIDLPFDHRQISYNFIHLNQVNILPLNSIIDVQIRVLRDYGISTGTRNESLWSRRDLHVDQDGVHIGMTLWNNQARLIDQNMAGLKIKFKRVKVSWFDDQYQKKISYHFIHANPSVLFENNFTLGLFIKVLIHYLLRLTAAHKCSSFNINFTLKKYTITNLILLLTPYISILRLKCTECHILSNCITAAETAYLLVLNARYEFTVAIDLNVYSKNQQFRLFDCVKKGKGNSLLPCTYFLFNNGSEISYMDLLQKSIVTNIQQIDLPIVYLENNQFLCKLINTTVSSQSVYYNLNNLSDINAHIKLFFSSNTNCASISNLSNSNITPMTTYINIDQSQYQIQQFIPFVEKIIKSDTLHQGYIYSCVRGNHNKDLLFFNIGGQYRFCPRKGTHHQNNTTAILIDIKNYTYCIRCKDPDCNNCFLLWNSIE
ncbi:unnamed protein product [Rotaria sp. Silwood2]|nr:unnamed protein product [Rotaria sp. Silwood2]CAF3064285.1 unnamed protein product [Rotaria sp. Silwood2]CAF3359031.1 unnamed protein product [Rotaria sp. Silwood2]